LQTVTWLIEGEVRHTDSLGNDVTILPGQLNLMSAGYGVAHAERGAASASRTHGVQLWIAQPDRTRNTEPSFDHYAELPTVGVGSFTATVLAGSFFGERSPAQTATPIVGVEITGHGRATVPLDPRFEYGVAVLDGPVRLDGTETGTDVFADLSIGRAHVVIESVEEVRLLLLGGIPFPVPILMWWNFVARTRSEIEDAWQAWSERSLRFGDVVSELDAIDTAPPSWMAK
jgi:redox-sensitive bicupin YhaK (pirin superfamily)